MDQIAAMGLKALGSYKEALEGAAAQVDIAKDLLNKVKLFEVTIGMIPRRGDNKKMDEIAGKSEMKVMNEEIAASNVEKKERCGEGLGECFNFFINVAENEAFDQLKKVADGSPFGKKTFVDLGIA
jgi:hypothetical protein